MNDGRRSAADLEAKRNAGTCLALAGLLFIGAGLFGLAVVVLPDLLMAVVFVSILGGFVLLHYLTWGRWLSRPRPGDDVADRDRGIPEPAPDDFADVD
jgi:hypothetical protein